MKKSKKVPQRKCVACQERREKKDLVRVVRNKEGEIFLDKTGKANGRGAYVCANKECMEKAIKTKAFNRAFKLNVDEEVYNHLLTELEEDDN